MSEVVRVENLGGTRVVTLNRPQARNALTREVLTLARRALDDASSALDVRCVVLCGADGHFCSGADLRQNLMDDPEMMDHLEVYMDAFHGLVKSVVRCDKPTIAMMDGGAVGFGADLAFACDLRVASTRAYAQEKFVKIGLMPDGGGTFWLPRLVGTARAMQMILLADKVEAEELHRLGVVAKVVDAAALRDATLAVARQIEAGPPLALAAAKRSIYASWGSFEEALLRERTEQLKLLRSADSLEGVAAWMQKREPNFRGE
ncbi:MAG TPA: enoyl-CoA hydratase-related protein [Polyangiaceae bacterium]|jgi:2-(1,2-epoxy-1,2-dihydrophenyl)acetyl-CoA isomerase|nr:enoyl-CoA hydratase-related protein [Polyangiaceae bacterium]